MSKHKPKPKPKPRPKALGIFAKMELRFEDRTGIILHDETKAMLNPNASVTLIPTRFTRVIKKYYTELG